MVILDGSDLVSKRTLLPVFGAEKLFTDLEAADGVNVAGFTM